MYDSCADQQILTCLHRKMIHVKEFNSNLERSAAENSWGGSESDHVAMYNSLPPYRVMFHQSKKRTLKSSSAFSNWRVMFQLYFRRIMELQCGTVTQDKLQSLTMQWKSREQDDASGCPWTYRSSKAFDVLLLFRHVLFPSNTKSGTHNRRGWGETTPAFPEKMHQSINRIVLGNCSST